MSFRHPAQLAEPTLIVVADRGAARLFSAPWPQLEPCVELEGFVHPESRLREHDTVSDRPGRFRTPTGHIAATDVGVDFQHRTAERFAHELLERLESGRKQQEFGRLVLVAPAKFLGELRRELPRDLERMVVAELNRDLVRSQLSEIMEHVRSAIAEAAVVHPGAE